MQKIIFLITVVLTLNSGVAFGSEMDSANLEISSTKQVAELVNIERSRYGLKKLVGDVQLSKVAAGHARDMYAKNYFSHQSLDGRTMSDRLHEGNINYHAAGENIARGQQTAERVMQAWMNSPGHRRNILSPKFGKIGIARAGNVWVQDFSN